MTKSRPVFFRQEVSLPGAFGGQPLRGNYKATENTPCLGTFAPEGIVLGGESALALVQIR